MQYDPLTGDPLPNSQRMGNSMPQMAAAGCGDLTALDSMTRQQLVALIKRIGGAMWGVVLMTDEQRAEAMLDRMAIIALTSADQKAASESMREWLDRKLGRSVQRIEQKNLNINATTARELTTEEIMARLGGVGARELESSGVKLIGGRVERIEAAV